MSTRMNPAVLRLASLVFIAAALCSCGKSTPADRPATDPSTGDSPARQTSAVRRPSGFASPVYVGSRKMESFMKQQASLLALDPPTFYNRADMIHMTVPYVQRVRRASRQSQSNPNPPSPEELVRDSTEQLILYLDGQMLKYMLDSISNDCTGLIAIFAVQRDTLPNGLPKNQTFFLVPFNEGAGQVVAMDDPIGGERWPSVGDNAYTLDDMGPDARVKVDEAFTSLGMK